MNQKTDIEKLFRSHYERMYNLARCILYDEDEAKDVVSDVFTRIIKDNICLLPATQEGYLLRAARNECLNRIAHKSIKEQVCKMLIATTEIITSEKEDERWNIIQQIIDHLEPPLRKRILEERFLQEMSYQEIAQHEGVSKVTVYNHLSQAMDFIRKQFNQTKK